MTTNKRPITAEDLWKLALYNDPQFSPDGSCFAYTVTTIDEEKEYRSHLYIQSLEQKHTRQWTFGKVRDSEPRFSPDGKQIAFFSNRSGVNQLWLLPTDGGEACQLTYLKHGAGEPHWSPDSNFLLFSAPLASDDIVNRRKEPSEEERKREKEANAKKPLYIDRLAYKSDGAGLHDDKRQQLILYDLNKEEFTQLTTHDCDHEAGSWSPDGRSFAFTANREPDPDRKLLEDVFTIDIATQKITKMTDSQGAYVSPSWSPDGQRIACFGHEYEYDGATLMKVWIIDVNSKERTCLTENWDVQVGDVMIGDIRSHPDPGPVWTADGNTLHFIASEQGHTGIYQVTLQGTITQVFQEDNHVYGFSYHPASNTFIAGISDPTNPGDFYLVTERKKEQLTEANKKLKEAVTFSVPEPIKAQADDGWDVHGWILRPVGYQEGERYPLILEIHGGPHAMYGQTFFHELQLLAAKGYAVLYTNPRGSDGYGQTFVDACRGDYGGKDYTDLMRALDHALDTYDFIDESRLGVTGGSYGGFMTNWMVAHTDRFKAAVTQRSISNWLSFYGVSDIGSFFTKWEVGNHLWEDPERLWGHSPLKYAEKVTTPILILHGEKDLRCPIEQGEQWYITLKHLRKEAAFVRFPGATHELSRSGPPDLRVERLNYTCGWFEKYL